MATTWNPSDKGSHVTLSGGNLTVNWASGLVGGEGVRATLSQSSGKWYWEVRITSTDALNSNIGLANATAAVTALAGTTANSISVRLNDGQITKNGGLVATLSGGALATTDTLCIAYDADAGSIAFAKNGGTQTTVSGANVPTGALFPTVSSNSADLNDTLVANFGATAFSFTPPTGFVGFDSGLTMVMSGGVLVGGAATFFPPGAITMAGGVLVGGAADMQFRSAFVLTGNGGALVGGAAAFDFPTTKLDALLPPYQSAASLVTGTVLTGTSTLPPYTSAAAVLAGGVATLAETLPAFTMLGDFGWFAANTLPARVLDATLLVGTISSADLTLPVYGLSAAVISSNLLTGDSTLPVYVLDASSITGGTSSAALLLPVHQLAAAGFTGAVLSGSNTLPLYALVAQGFAAYTLSGANTLPAYQLDAAMSQAISAAFRAWVLNLHKRPLTEYTNFPFNSFAVCEGRTFAAGPNGVFELTEATSDAGTAIASVARTGKHNFGVSYAKRVPRIYAAVATAGDLEFRTITGADGRRGYLLPWNQTTEVQQRRIPIGGGPKSTYWQFELVNRAGADFTLDALIIRPNLTTRRVSPG